MAVKWRNFASQWEFIGGNETSMSWGVTVRAFLVRYFGQSVFTANSPRQEVWFNSYIIDGDIVLQKAQEMNAAIRRLNAAPPTTIYQQFLRDIKHVGEKINVEKFQSPGLDEITKKLSTNPLINLSVLEIKKIEKKLARLNGQMEDPAILAKYSKSDLKAREASLKKMLKTAEDASKALTLEIRTYVVNYALGDEKLEFVSQVDSKQLGQRLQAALLAIKNEQPHDILELLTAEIRQMQGSVYVSNFKSAYLDYAVEMLCADKGGAGNTASLNPYWDEFNKLRDFVARGYKVVVPAIESEFQKARVHSSPYYNAIRDYLIQRAQSEIKNEAPPMFAYPGTQYAMYLHQCGKSVKPLPPPTTGAVVGLRMLHPFNLLDATVGALSIGSARVLCGIVDFFSGEKKTSAVAVGVKWFLVWPFVLVKIATSFFAALTNRSSWSEPERTRITPLPVGGVAARYAVNAPEADVSRHSAPGQHRRFSSNLVSSLLPSLQQQTSGDAKKAFTPPPLVHAKTGIRLSQDHGHDVSVIRMEGDQHRGSVVSSVGSDKKDSPGLFNDKEKGKKAHRRERSSYPPASAVTSEGALFTKIKPKK